MANRFNESKNNWFSSPSSAVDEDIVVISEDSVTTQVSNSSSRNNPVPNIIIGKNSLDTLPIDTSPEDQTGQVDSQPPVADQKKIDISNPQDGDMIRVLRPDFFGSAPINSRVVIEVHSDTAISGETVSDVSGSWHWSPPENLAPGEHTITVKSQNGATGIWETVTRRFTVLATDNSTGPSFEASSSATPTLEPTTEPTPTSVPTERVARPSTTVKPPVTGNSFPTVAIILFSCVFMLISFKLIL